MKNNFNKTALRFNRKKFVFISLSTILIFQPSIAQVASRENLVSADWLNLNLKNAEVLIIDASPSQLYILKHIPGAINYDIFNYGPQNLPVSEIENSYQALGISLGKKIVIYDQGGTFFATRLFFALDYFGFPSKNLYILDGGISKWQEKGLTVTSEPATVPKKGSFKIGKLKNDIRADLSEFIEASGNPENNSLVEALDPDWHFGSLNIFGRPGHVPYAILLPIENFFNPDRTFKSTEEINKIMTYLDIDPGKNVYSHCGGGIAASVPFFAIKYLCGYTSVKLFPGSLLEWTADERELPLWTYDSPYLMRNTNWLQGWGGMMNVPPEVFRSNITNNLRITEALGRAGVDASTEAVVISGGGLTKEAALAFVMLEKLGQNKVSLYMGDADKWNQLGFNVIRDTNALDAKTLGQDLSGQTSNYPVNLYNNKIITECRVAQGLYPRVIIASGNELPEQTLEGTVIHLPSTDLLNTDGTPKEAKNIWEILSKAGVPRFAEIVCYSDDPGEAAVTFFILKLMGFKDVKVLMNN